MDATDFAAALPRLQSLLGLAAFCAIAWGFSEARDRFPWRMALGAVGVQIALAALFLYAPGTRDALAALNVVIETLQVASEAGTTLVFGHLGGGPAPFTVTDEGALFNLAFRGLPLVIFMSALAALLWHLGVLRLMIGALAAGLERAFGVGGAVALAASANVLLGQTEAPLLIRAYLNKLTRSEFFVVLAGGLATVAGTVMVLYALILAPVVPAALGHILLASIISAPAAILMARIIVPPDADETPTPTAAGSD
ncbi:MAG: Na+ dependent nucleoside transporter N-terminal domain-containing protein, partial [Pseudomonadota bacterium]